MEPKPLSTDRLKELLEAAQPEESEWVRASALYEALQAERYWRETVKNAPEFAEDGQCNFCTSVTAGLRHAPDCPWVLAQ